MIRKLLPLALLAGCAQAAPPPPADRTPVHGDTGYVCNADGLTDLVGRPATAELGAGAMKRAQASTVRWIQPGMMVTMDFRRDRLDIHLDQHNVVTKLSCG